MANTVIQLKYSNTSNTPNTLSVGEPAYSFLSDKFFIGNTTNGVITVGGKYYTDIIDAASFSSTPSTLVLRDTNSNIFANTIYANVVGSVLDTVELLIESTDEIVVDTLDPSQVRSSKFEVQLSHQNMHGVSEIRLLIDEPNVFITQYGLLGEHLGSFSVHYSPVSASFSSPSINNDAISYWSENNVRIYTTNVEVINSLLFLPEGTGIIINDSITLTLVSSFVQVAEGIYDATVEEVQPTIQLINKISWSGTGLVQLRFSSVYANTLLKYNKTVINV